MKIINGGGRLFGMINVIDFLVILFLLSLAPMFYFAYKIFHAPPPRTIVEQGIICKFNNVDLNDLELIKVGDKQINDTTNEVEAEVLEIMAVEPCFYTIETKNGGIITKQRTDAKQVWARLKIRGELKYGDMFYLYQGNSIYPGVALDFKTKKYSLRGIIQKRANFISNELDLRAIKVDIRLVEVVALFSNVNDTVLTKIKVGDYAKDKNEEINSKVLAIASIKTSFDKDGYSFGAGASGLITSSVRKNTQVTLVLQLRCEVLNDEIYFNQAMIKPGCQITFETKDYSIIGTVISL